MCAAIDSLQLASRNQHQIKVPNFDLISLRLEKKETKIVS